MNNQLIEKLKLMIQQAGPYRYLIILTIVAIFCSLFVTSESQKESDNNNVYSVHNIKYFKNDLLSLTMGCDYKVAYGYIQYPEGALDALHIATEPGRYSIGQHCKNSESFAHLFGSNQNYTNLLEQSPQIVAGKAKVVLGRIGIRNVIVNWNQLFTRKLETVRKFLDELIKSLESDGFTVYLKAPASFFCYTEEGTRFILGVKAKNFIIQMYGQNPTAYTNFEEIFINTDTKLKFPVNSYYPEQSCSQYPSLAMLKNYDGNFFVGATLEKQQPGYHGVNMEIFVKKAKKEQIYKNYVFYDHLPFNVIPV